ncbi:MAG: prephenate dehydratase [Geminicoccaceae bacterium]
MSAGNIIAFQGLPGANSHMACTEAFPRWQSLPCHAFEDAFGAVRERRAALAMIPIENSVAGRVADVHHLLPQGELHIVGEHFQRVSHFLLAKPGVDVEQIRVVHSHVHALGQCRNFIKRHGLEPVVHADTAGAAQMIASQGEPGHAAIASSLAAEIYGLDILASGIEDAAHNTTRFLVMASDPITPPPDPGRVITSFAFRVRNVPASLYKAMGGFATNAVNMTKLESYVEADFNQAFFYADVIGHPSEPALSNAFEELNFFTERMQIFGVYPAHPFRFRQSVTD